MSNIVTPVEEAYNESYQYPQWVRFIAQLISVVFHPLFVPVYITLFLLFVHPLLFAGYEETRKLRLLATVLVNLTFLPLITVFLSWRLGFLVGMSLKNQKERIIPLAAAMIFYFWCWFVLRNFVEIPALFRDFLFGSFLTIIAAWLGNIVYKISLHALAMGGMLAYVFILLYTTEGGSAWYLAAALLIAGMVSTSRLLTRAHVAFDVYSGIIIGALCQVVARVI